MTRREFMAAVSAAGLAHSRASGSTPFPVHYAKPSPYEALLRYIDPGSDEFKGEKDALELEARLERIFAGRDEAPAGLRSWMARRAEIRAARFYALPENRVRYEIKLDREYHTGVWQLPDFRAVAEQAATSPKPFFRDVTGHVFGGVDSFREQLIPGNPYWRARLDSACGIDVYGNQGIVVGDIDNDGVDEIYVCQPGGLPNRLYKFRADGTAEDITDRSGLGVLDETTCALFCDFRNSGYQDAVVLRSSGPLYFVNRGDGTFVEQRDAFAFKTTPQGSFTGMAAADFDRDGRLDLYLCCYIYFQSEDQYQYPAPYQDARNGPPNFLFHNTGTRFEDVTAETGINENNDRFSFSPAWCDFDGDGWPDLYVANDFGRGNLYRNREGHFRDEAAKAGLDGAGPGMNAAWFDYDGDGRADLYVSDMWTAAGQRVIRDPAFQPAGRDAEAFRRHTKGNCLYRNKGDGTFEETSATEGVEMGRWAWSSGGFDWDLDGAPEILIGTGMVTNRSKKDLNSFFWRRVVAKTPEMQRAAGDYENGWNALNQLIREDYSWNGREPNVFYVKKDGRYRDASGVSGLDFAEDTRTFAVTDFDGDGVPDLVLKNRLGPQIRAMQNDCSSGRKAIAIGLKGTKSNRDAIGARVEVNGQTQWIAAGSGFLSQHSKKLHFGLAGLPSARVKIIWPSGAVQETHDLEPGYVYTIVEGASEPTRTAFRASKPMPSVVVHGKNDPEFGDAWLLEPVPTPDRRTAGFVVLHSGQRPQMPAGVPVEMVDLKMEKDDVAAAYSLFRRYLFEYRKDLSLPLVLLVDGESRARKIYPDIPSTAQMHSDLARIDQSHALALPFPGKYYLNPRRNYFKLGAAFYWAGYPDRALPYLAETLRAHPENWKALHAVARIQLELGRSRDALQSFQQLIEKKGDYPPAFVGAGEAYAKQDDRANARKMLERALELDPRCADAMNQLGLLSAGSDDFEGARKWFQKAIEAQQDHPGAINNLGVLYAKLGQPNDAVAAFRYGIKANPDDDELYLNLARIYVTMGQRDKARSVLVELMDRKPGNAIATKALGELEAR
ncbi:MAG TPA: FG-GAP-like repeat-containing protein [Bryobacteraceae bacterium]|jgi:Flp pilus assembly protein TadD|nr:FG-GAP-like repeat-containing protein [Bryobacteraceae bacterium]